MLDSIGIDLRHAIRQLARAPGFTAAAVLTLGFGLGAATAVFSVVDGVLLSPLPYREPDALVRLGHRIGGIDQPYFSDGVYLAYADHARAFADLGVWVPGETAAVTGRGAPEQVRSLTASRGVLTTLGVSPVIGRWFSAAEDAPGGLDVVLLGHGYWQRRFAGDRAVVDRSLVVDGRPHRIVGVMPAGFRFAGEIEIVRPLRVDPGAPIPSFRLLGVARLRPGVTPAQADADVVRVLGAWFDRTGARPEVRARWAPALRPLAADVVGDVGRTLWVLMGAIGVVLLLACANVATLLLTRAERRRQELAIRAALGAGRSRLSRQLFVESLLLALTGGVVGVVVAAGAIRALTALGPAKLPRLHEITVNPTALAFALGMALSAGALLGMVPLLRHGRPRLDDLAIGGRGASQGRGQQRSQQALVAAQLALALMLLVSAGLMIRSFQALRSVDPGFVDPARLQAFSLTIPATSVPEAAGVTRMQHEVVERLTAIPGVTAAAFTTRLPFGVDRSSSALAVEGVPDDGTTPANRQVKVVSPGSFAAQGTPIVSGRDFTWTDLHESRQVAIVSAGLAREIWGLPEAALGRRVREYDVADAPWWEVVGVAADVHDDGVDSRPPATLYWPAQASEALQSMAGYQSRRVTFAVRSDRAGTAPLLDEIGRAVWAVDPALPLARVETLGDAYGESMTRTAFTLVILGVAAAMALALGVSGLYAVVAFAVARRRREIGIRLALGARAVEIRRLFLRRGLLVATAGVAGGLAGAAAITRVMRSLLFGVGPFDPITMAAMTLLLFVVAIAATDAPARRAAAVDPVETLRAD